MKKIKKIINEEISEMFSGNDWAVFHVSKGYGKCFVVELSDVTKNGVKSCDYGVKYSDPSVLKFPIEQAIDIIKTNVYAGGTDVWGIVNARGIQKTFDWRVKFPDKYDWDGNEIKEELHKMISVDEKAKASQHYLDPDYSPTDDELKIAQKTSRTQKYDPTKKGRGFGEAITPGYAISLAGKNDKILDFGAGKGAPYVEKYRQMGYDIWGVDLPANMAAWEEGIAPSEGFTNQFDLVYASNVLNVQSSENFLRSTIRSILKALKPTGIFVGNYPASPRKMPEMTELTLEGILKEYFNLVSYDKSKKIFTCREPK